MKQKLFTFFLALAASAGSMFAASGTCGDNLTWDLTDGVLTISGTGTMTDWSYTSDVPWYSYRESIVEVSIGNSVTSIGSSAFAYCTGLTSITIPNSVTSIGWQAFAGCSGLTSIEIPNSVTCIGDYAFDYCTGLTSVHISDIATWCNIDFDGSSANPLYYAHHLCVNHQEVTELTIPESVTGIGDYAFYGCTDLTSVTIPNSVTSIGDYAFYGCTSLPVVDDLRYADTYLIEAVDKTLSTYNIKEDTKWIGDHAFYNCTGLTSITIPNSVTSIGDGAFSGCTSLPVVDDLRYADTYLIEAVDETLSTYTIKKGTRWIGNSAFDDCPLTTIIIPEGVQVIKDHAFKKCERLVSVSLPNSLKSIERAAFEGCSKLKSITIPNQINNITDCSFGWCNDLETIVISSSVSNIEGLAFAECNKLKSVTCFAAIPPTMEILVEFSKQSSVFNQVDCSQVTLYVPAGSVDAYNAADQWKDFGSIMPISAKDTETTRVATTTTENTVDVTWPVVNGAYAYELVIKDKAGNIVCTLVFNAQGQLLSIKFNAPAQNGAPQHTQAAGFAFTVTGLEDGSWYNYTLTSKNESGTILKVEEGTFRTQSYEAVDEVSDGQSRGTKLLRNGQILIRKGNKTFDLRGQEVR